MAFTWKQLQDEQHAWRIKNFGPQPQHHSVLGLFEELGELDEARCRYNNAEAMDAIADCMVYATAICTDLSISIGDIVSVAEAKVETLRRMYRNSEQEPGKTLRLIGSLSHSLLKMEQGIRGSREHHTSAIRGALTEIIEGILLTCAVKNWKLLAVVQPVWEQVQKRDWTKNKLTGAST